MGVDVCATCFHRCIDALRQLETPEGWSHPAVGLLALQAFLASGNAQQAETEASGVCVRAVALAASATDRPRSGVAAVRSAAEAKFFPIMHYNALLYPSDMYPHPAEE
jgi:hypothetical protein